jgi:hypothetical protein
MLTGHPGFRPHVTPVQLFNKATDPFLPGVKPHLFDVLRGLDERGPTNLVLLITRFRVTEADMAALEQLRPETGTCCARLAARCSPSEMSSPAACGARVRIRTAPGTGHATPPIPGSARKAGFANIAHARRHYARHDQRILALYGYA